VSGNDVDIEVELDVEEALDAEGGSDETPEEQVAGQLHVHPQV
jgi:hypothetical protein